MKVKTRTLYKLVGSDYSAQEPRITTFLGGDPAMRQAYLEGKDLYCVIAANIYNNKYEDNLEHYPEGTVIELDGKQTVCGHKTHLNKAGKERRSVAKMVLLALTYGMGTNTLAARTGKTRQEAQEIFDNFFKSFPKVEELINSSKQFLKDHGYVEDWAGRRRHLTDYFLPPYEATYKDEETVLAKTFNPILGCENRPLEDTVLTKWINMAQASRGNKAFDKLAKEALEKDGVILTANTGRIAQAERQCLNARIQGSAASLTKLAMIQIHNSQELKDLDAKLVMTIHDEVMLECPALYAEQASEILPRIMIEAAAPYIDVPMKCDPAIESRWYTSEYAVAIQEEFKKLTKQGLDRDTAFEKLYTKHPELPQEAIYKTITEGIDLEF
jgi:DNA polymerase I-like protein with 3'-5' exonuclease and polymerase domains